MCDKSVDIYHSKIKFFLNTIRLKHCPDKDITQIMCDEGVDDSLATSKFTPDCFVTSKMIIMLSTQMKIYSILMKILLMSHFVMRKWVFLI